jgi:23S rRNA A2030 N6-methylase RlmJ
MIWYPIKSHSPLQALHQAAIDLDINRTWVAEYLIHPRDKTDSFNGCGVLFLNTPYQIPEQLDAATAELTRCLGGQIESRYLVGG